MSKQVDSTDTVEDVKKQYIKFLEALKNHKDEQLSRIPEDPCTHLEDCLSSDLKKLIEDVDLFIEFSFGSTIRSKNLKQALKRLKASELKKLNTCSIILSKKVMDTELCHDYEQQSRSALELSTALLEELSNRF